MIISLYKKRGVSSLECYKHIKSKFNKVGHCGTLDIYAAGIIRILIDESTKKLRFLIEDKKTYVFGINFNFETISGDVFSEIIQKNNIFTINKNDFLQKVEKIKKEGILKEILEKTNKSISFFKKGRIAKTSVSIFDLQIFYKTFNIYWIKITVSKGFYVRSFAKMFNATAIDILRIKVGENNISKSER